MLLAPLLLLALAAPPDVIAPPPTAQAPADPVARLLGSLAALPATTPVRARVEHRVRYAQGDEDAATPTGMIAVTAAAGPEGVRVTWGPSLLARAEAEERARLQDPDAHAPTRDAVGDLRALALARALDAVPELVRELADARLVSDAVETLDGVPTRVLTLRVKPVLPARDRKYVKDVDATVRLALGPDGVPLTGERRVLVKGRIFLVITFEIEIRDVVRFGRSGDRLLELRRDSEMRSAGAGERRDRYATTVLSVLP